MEEKIRIYVVAKIAPEMHAWTDTVCLHLELDGAFDVFKPKDFNPWWLPPEKIESSVMEMDYRKIDESHIGLILPDYGHDCACEIGYYFGHEKPIVVFSHDQVGWLEHFWTKASLSLGNKTGCVATDNPKTYEILRNDESLKFAEVTLVGSLSELPGLVKAVYRRRYVQSP